MRFLVEETPPVIKKGVWGEPHDRESRLFAAICGYHLSASSYSDTAWPSRSTAVTM